MKKILFVCTQNVFRSMSAKYLMKKYLYENNIYDLDIDSAGTLAYSFEAPYQTTVKRLFELGVDVRDHENKRIDEKLLEKTDLIICMTKLHQKHIKDHYGKKTILFNEIAYQKQEDLLDDNETDFDSLNIFLIETVDYINQSIPYIYENLDLYLE